MRYYGDGTGRDSYVVQDFGGLVYNYAAENKSVGNFYKTLRSGSMVQSIDAKPGSMYFATKNWLSPKARRVIKDSYLHQVTLSNRLSTPKSGVSRPKTFEGVGTLEEVPREESLEKQTAPVLRPNVMMRIANNRNQAGRNHKVQEGAHSEKHSHQGSIEPKRPTVSRGQTIDIDTPKIILSETPREFVRRTTEDRKNNSVFQSVSAKIENIRSSLEASKQQRSSDNRVEVDAPP